MCNTLPNHFGFSKVTLVLKAIKHSSVIVGLITKHRNTSFHCRWKSNFYCLRTLCFYLGYYFLTVLTLTLSMYPPFLSFKCMSSFSSFAITWLYVHCVYKICTCLNNISSFCKILLEFFFHQQLPEQKVISQPLNVFVQAEWTNFFCGWGWCLHLGSL